MAMDLGGSKGGTKSEINVTPLVDIVLVLLIIFIVITPAVNDSVRLPVAKHSARLETDREARCLTLLLPARRDSSGRVLGPGPVGLDAEEAKHKGWSLENPGDRNALAGIIRNATGRMTDRRVFVKADADLPFKFVDELFLVCREGGAAQASIITGEDKEQERP